MKDRPKVIESGNSKDAGCYVKQVTCTGKGQGGGGCGAVLEVNMQHIYPNNSTNGFHFVCPECHNYTSISVPAQIAQQIRSRYDSD